MQTMRKQGIRQYNLEQLRSRHRFCISGPEVARMVRAGRIPKYFDNPTRYAPYCEHLEDGICAAPDIADSVYEKYEGTQGE